MSCSNAALLIGHAGMQNDRSEMTTVAVLGRVSEGGQNSNSIHRRQSSRAEGSLSFAKLEDVGGQGRLVEQPHARGLVKRVSTIGGAIVRLNFSRKPRVGRGCAGRFEHAAAIVKLGSRSVTYLVHGELPFKWAVGMVCHSRCQQQYRRWSTQGG